MQSGSTPLLRSRGQPPPKQRRGEEVLNARRARGPGLRGGTCTHATCGGRDGSPARRAPGVGHLDGLWPVSSVFWLSNSFCDWWDIHFGDHFPPDPGRESKLFVEIASTCPPDPGRTLEVTKELNGAVPH